MTDYEGMEPDVIESCKNYEHCIKPILQSREHLEEALSQISKTMVSREAVEK